VPSTMNWMKWVVAMLALAFTTAHGFVEAIISYVDGASVAEQADRGEQQQVTDPRPTITPYGLPVADAAGAAWGTSHSAYPATDIFVGCGAALVSPVHGTVLEVRRVDSWDPGVDNPATRGGRSVAIRGFDGVRYYLAHFDTIEPGLAVGQTVVLGQALGTMGESGRTSACHLHFSISPPCPGREWSVRRGVVWPYPYLDAWRKSEQLSPVAEVERWLIDHPTACAEAMADPFAPDA
jgi:murein DD-endopeptidase MepM/ murein hydrolase activator NlpD